jgi:hypothetical protein
VEERPLVQLRAREPLPPQVTHTYAGRRGNSAPGRG